MGVGVSRGVVGGVWCYDAIVVNPGDMLGDVVRVEGVGLGDLRSVHAVAPCVAQGALAFCHGDGGVEGAAGCAGAGLYFASDCVDGRGGRLMVVRLTSLGRRWVR